MTPRTTTPARVCDRQVVLKVICVCRGCSSNPSFLLLSLLPPTNFHHVLFDNPPGNQYPRNHVLYIDGLTGEQRTHGEFYERVRDSATAFASAKDDGGLGLRSGMVAIFAPNCIVRFLSLCDVYRILIFPPGLQRVGALMLAVDHSIRVASVKTNNDGARLLAPEEQSYKAFRSFDSTRAGTSSCERNWVSSPRNSPLWRER